LKNFGNDSSHKAVLGVSAHIFVVVLLTMLLDFAGYKTLNHLVRTNSQQVNSK